MEGRLGVSKVRKHLSTPLLPGFPVTLKQHRAITLLFFCLWALACGAIPSLEKDKGMSGEVRGASGIEYLALHGRCFSLGPEGDA